MNAAVDAVRSKGEVTRERILDAAEQLFAELAFEGTTLREIAALVGIREPSLYTHFAGKDAIYAAVIDRALIPFSDLLQDWNRSELTVKTLFDMPARLVQLHARHPYSAQILHREFTSPPARISPQVLQWQQQFVAQSQRFMEGLPDGVLTGDARSEETGQEKAGMERSRINKTQVVANMITCTNLILGIFSTRGMQMQLLGEDYDAEQVLAEHLRLANRIFKSLVMRQ